MHDPSVLIDVADGVATITLNRPAQLNALNEGMRIALADALVRANADPDVRVLILTGAGRAFCVGQDPSAVDELADCEDCVRRTYNPVVDHIANLDKPVIAAINGPAVGAGMGFALGCDLVMMAEGSFLSCAFGKVGLVPDSGATFHLARALGHPRAFEIASTGRRVAPDEAVALGLANRVVPSDRLMDDARDAATALVGEPAKAMMLTKRLLRAAQDGSLATALSAEALAQGVLGATDAHLALRAAFLQKARK